MDDNQSTLQADGNRPPLKEALLSVEHKFITDLKHRKATNTHPTATGDATESAWIALLREYLPSRYQVAKAFVMDHKGATSKQLDCVIYDAYFTPKLFGEDSSLYVPAEAVYATFEIKQAVDAQHIKAASQKAASVQRLTRTSVPLNGPLGIPNPVKTPFPIITGLLAMEASWVDGLSSEAFQTNIQALNGDESLALVLTGEHGFYDALDSTGAPEVVTGAGSLMRGLFRLIRALRALNTVTPIDWNEYENVLKD